MEKTNSSIQWGRLFARGREAIAVVRAGTQSLQRALHLPDPDELREMEARIGVLRQRLDSAGAMLSRAAAELEQRTGPREHQPKNGLY
ncbi:MAG: hypothetical protein GMKNLPBB_02534 [Myxococcota bacterium]|nr:hypothetical protein [Myxococcota bacterium]